MPGKLKNILLFLAQTKFFFYSLIWLFVLVSIGTIAQYNLGLFQAQQLYFSTYISYMWGIPVPGGYLTCGYILTALLIKLTLSSPYRYKNIGIMITHIGAFLLLAGSVLTAFFSEEGNMLLTESPPTNISNQMASYHHYELVAIDAKDKNFDQITVFKSGWLKKNELLEASSLPFRIKISDYFKNTSWVKRGEFENNLAGIAQVYKLKHEKLKKEAEENLVALEIEINHKTYYLLENLEKPEFVEFDGQKYFLTLQKEQTRLPFSIKLDKFSKITYPGTDKAESYESVVTVVDGDLEQRKVIQMNEPLRYKGYTFYQSSYIERDGHEASILAVVKNSGRMMPYISSIIMCLGILIHLLIRFFGGLRKNPGKKKKYGNSSVALILFCLFNSNNIVASPASKIFGQLPILEEGRVKPLDTYARNFLLSVYEKRSLKALSAVDWFLELLLDQEAAYKRPVFRVRNQDLADMLILPKQSENSDHAYSYKQIIPGLEINIKAIEQLGNLDQKKLAPAQRQLIELFHKVNRFYEISRALSGVTPSIVVGDKKLAEKLSLKQNQSYSYLKFLKSRAKFIKLLEAYENSNSEANGELNAIARQLERISWDTDYRNLQIIPMNFELGAHQNLKTNPWVSPWESLMMTSVDKPSAIILVLEKFASSYKNNVKFEGAAAELQKLIYSKMPSEISGFRLKLEQSYNQIKPFQKAVGFYVLGFILLMLGFAIFKNLFFKLSFLSLIFGVLINLTGLVMRIIIMQRPPVATLYETILFVGLFVPMAGLAIEFVKKNKLGLLLASSSGVILNLIGFSYAADGDTMGMLQAVLNSNFWLTIHVLVITTGYVSCFVTGFIGHVFLIKKAFPKLNLNLAELKKLMHSSALFSLLFTSVGTILGGIWADQSWGRFWGWDPKENGALLIVLWLIILLHGRISKQLNYNLYAAGLVLLNIIVSLAWFGVNLLNVGLHSYGFSDGAATGLFAFALIEVGFLLLTWLLLSRRVS